MIVPEFRTARRARRLASRSSNYTWAWLYLLEQFAENFCCFSSYVMAGDHEPCQYAPSFSSERVQALFFDKASGRLRKIWCLGTRLRCLKRQDCKYSPFQAKFTNGKYSHRLWSVIHTKCWESFMWSHSESECVKERKALVSNSTLVWIHSLFSELQCCCSGFPTSTKACQGVVWHKTHECASTPPLDLNRWLPLIHTCKSYFDLTSYTNTNRHRNSLGHHVCSLVDLVLRPF